MVQACGNGAAGPDPVPLAARIGFTLWMAVWVPVVVSTQGPQNFWWLCNLAQFLLLWAVWRGDALIASSQAGVVVLVGLVWSLDFAAAWIVGESPTGITAYMFDDALPLALRVTSIYHVWLPVFAVWLVRRLGFDRRGVGLQCAIATLAIFGGWVFGDPNRNLNYTHAPFGIEQVWLPPPLYVAVVCLGTALLVLLPGHWLVGRLARARAG